jgi:ankyrin repeat protein
MFAASEGQLEVVKVLMANGADASLKDIDGDTAEAFAVQNKHPEVAQFLANYSNN